MRKKRILGIDKKRFYLYLILLLLAIVASIVVVILGKNNKDSIVINYFISFAASLVITDIFAFIVDWLNCISLKEKIILSYISPLKDNINELFYRVMFSYNEKEECSIIDFKDGLVKSLNEYSECIDRLIIDRDDFQALNMANGIKMYYEKRCLCNIRNEFNRIFANKYELLDYGIFNEMEMFEVEIHRKTLEFIAYPLFDILEPNNAGENGKIIWPERHIDDIYRHNFESSCEQFVSFLIQLSKENKCFRFINDLKFCRNNENKNIGKIKE